MRLGSFESVEAALFRADSIVKFDEFFCFQSTEFVRTSNTTHGSDWRAFTAWV